MIIGRLCRYGSQWICGAPGGLLGWAITAQAATDQAEVAPSA